MKYTVYENDLKHKNMRNINTEQAEWYDETLKHKFENINHDNLSFRIEECIKTSFSTLDLSNLELQILPDFTHHNNYNNIKNIKYLFLNDNKITNIDASIKQFINIEILDISNNNIQEINYLPISLVELSCHNNKITAICIHDNIKRIDCSFNKLLLLNSYNNLTKLICNSNQLENIPTFNNLLQLICTHNPIKSIDIQPKLLFLDCSYTNIKNEISNFNLLNTLICHYTPIETIDFTKLLHLKTLEIAGSKITKLDYCSTLRELYYRNTDELYLSPLYKIINYYKEHDNTYIEFKV